MYQLLKRLLPERLRIAIETPLRSIYALFYIGSNVSCPLCDRSFRKFISINDCDLLCPRCGSIQRKRLLWLYLQNELNIREEQLRVLHFSPHRYLAKCLRCQSNIVYTTTDYESARADCRFDITKIHEPDAKYDLIICYHVLEHIPNDQQAMRELYRILNSKGTALIQTPWRNGETYEDPAISDPQERLEKFGQEDHVRWYGLNDLINRLKSVGFQVNPCQYALQLPAELIESNALNKSELIFVCTKKGSA